MVGSFKNKMKRKQQKYRNILQKDYGIEARNEITKILFSCNAGLVNGIQREDMINFFSKYGVVKNIQMVWNKSHSFITYENLGSAEKCYEEANGTLHLPGMKGPLYLLFVNTVPDIPYNLDFGSKPPGLILFENFISEAEEAELMNLVNFEDLLPISSMKNRHVKHYGFEFLYGTNNVDKKNPLEEGLPRKCDFVFERLKQNNSSYVLPFLPDQLTVNCYVPGQGIPPHIDTHSAFESDILSLSLGSSIVMDFKNIEGRQICVMLPPRSLLIMSGESRYAWTHGITPRKADVVRDENGLTVQERGFRISYTFRKIRKGSCHCNFTEFCDSFDRKLNICDKLASDLENLYVHKVYEQISSHFSLTRHSPWPKVSHFVNNFPVGSIVLDVGCGNAKYFGSKPGIFEVGCDYSFGLAKETKDRNFQVVVGDCLKLPFQSYIADGVISIAVIHHLATKARRIEAVKEMIRVLKTNGRAMIYVWAKDQHQNNVKSKYIKKNKEDLSGASSKLQGTEKITLILSHPEITSIGSPPYSVDSVKSLESTSDNKHHEEVILPIHSNRTEFQEQDVLVPWKTNVRKSCGNESSTTFLRFYHVFEENELEETCRNVKEAKVISSYYDEGNWCVILEKCI